MANKYDKNPGNAPGRWYVDSTCVDCDMCRQVAPAIFQRDAELGVTVAVRQPVTAEEIRAAIEAMESCPTESIGNDGE